MMHRYMQYETKAPGGSIDARYSVRKVDKRRIRLINIRGGTSQSKGGEGEGEQFTEDT